MITYAVVGSLSALIVLYPDLRQHVMLFFVPGALFEWTAAVWLLFAGINTRHWAAKQTAKAETS